MQGNKMAEYAKLTKEEERVILHKGTAAFQDKVPDSGNKAGNKES